MQLGLNPAQTLGALKGLINSGEILGNVTEAVKQSYLARIETAEAQYQKAGASGSFNAGVEYGKLLAEGASLVAGGVGVVKGGALLTEKITAKLVKEGVGEVVTAGSKGSLHTSLLDELAASGVKFTPENVIATIRSSSGQVVFLETGNSKAGLQHIIEEHGSQFVRMGVSEAEIPSVVMRAVSEGRLVGYQGSGTGRPIYELTINGQPQRIAVTVGNNGFVVGANPRGSVK
ncbi:hypothetical protein [Aeromonas popoffii]|uniref:hypothetical protein n=1 Tax=Aeromonas popoffii TaxID=70856 RepID=UPI0030CA6A65